MTFKPTTQLALANRSTGLDTASKIVRLTLDLLEESGADLAAARLSSVLDTIEADPHYPANRDQMERNKLRSIRRLSNAQNRPLHSIHPDETEKVTFALRLMNSALVLLDDVSDAAPAAALEEAIITAQNSYGAMLPDFVFS